MPARNDDLHGNAPDKSPAALILIDVVNDFEYEGGERLFEKALPAARRIAGLKRRAKQAGIPVIYANDNFGKWRSNFEDVVRHVLHDGVRGEPVGKLLQPDPDDYFVLKPKHSAFFSTTLETLLQYLGARTLVLTGFAGDMCVFFTGIDAYMRDYRLCVPADCVASIDDENNRAALDYMNRALDADLTPSSEIDLTSLLASASDARLPARDG